MANIFDMKKTHHHALTKAESIIQTAENAHRELTKEEEQDYETCITTVRTLAPQIKER